MSASSPARCGPVRSPGCSTSGSLSRRGCGGVHPPAEVDHRGAPRRRYRCRVGSPLATVGITFQYGFPTEAWNAFLLFLTNLAAIVFAASIALVLTGFRPSQYSGRGALRTRMAITLVVVAVIAIPLTVHTFTALEDTRLRRAVVGSVQAWDDQVRIVDLVSDATGGRATVDLLVSGSGDPRPVWVLADEIRQRFDGPVDLRLLYRRDDSSP